MKFTDCNFSFCREVGFSCKYCSHYDPNGVSNVKDPINPILGIPLSQVLVNNIYFEPFDSSKGNLHPIVVIDTVEPIQLVFDFKD